MSQRFKYLAMTAATLMAVGCTKYAPTTGGLNSPIRVVGGSITFTQTPDGNGWTPKQCFASTGYGACYSVQASGYTNYQIRLVNDDAANSPYKFGTAPWEVDFQVTQNGLPRVAVSLCSNLDPKSHLCTLAGGPATGNVYVVPASGQDGLNNPDLKTLTYQNQRCSAASCTLITKVQIKSTSFNYGPVPCSASSLGGAGKCQVGVESY